MKCTPMILSLGALVLASMRESALANEFIKPEAYAIKFDLSNNKSCIDKNCGYAVEVNITILVAVRMKSLVLQCGYDLKVDENRTLLRKRHHNGTFEDVEIYRHVYKRGKFVSTVEIEAQLLQNRRASRYVLTLFCEKKVRIGDRRIDGFLDNAEQSMFVSTYNSASSVHHMFPCLGDPLRSSTFDLTIIHPSSHRAVAGTLLSNRDDLTNEISQSTFKRTKKIPAYHLFFAVWNYVVDSSGASYDVWRRPNVPPKDIGLFVDYAKKSFEFMTNATGNRDPIVPRMNLVAYSGSDVAGWYSLIGATLIREKIVVFREDESTISDRFELISNVARSVVSQWVGVLVYPKFLTHPWLYKAFANYIADLMIDEIEPKWRCRDLRLAEEILWSGIDGEYPSAPGMGLFVFDVWNNRSYLWRDHLIVRRATSVISMIHEINDFETVNQSLKEFFKNWIDKKHSASPAELANSYENPQASVIMDDWLRNPGAPVLHVFLNELTSEIELSQERFYALGPWSKLPHHWLIPIRCYEIKTERYRHEWIFSNVTRSKAPCWMKWCLLNGTSSAPFRVNYPVEWWAEISEALRQSPRAINEIQRMRMIDDALALVLAGYRKPDIFFNLTRYLEHDLDYFPWLAAAKAFKKLRNILKYGDGEERQEKLRIYVLHLLSKVYDCVELKPMKGENYVAKLHRKNIMDLACGFGHVGCLEVAEEKLNCTLDAMESGSMPRSGCNVDPDVREIVFCQGLRRASNYTWKRLYDLSSDDHLFHSTKSTIKRSLGCTEDPKILRAYVGLVLEDTGNFPYEEALQIFLIAARINDDNAQIVLKNVVSNYQLLRARSQFPGELDLKIKEIAKEVYSYTIIHKIFLPFLWRNSQLVDVSLMYNMKDQATANVIFTNEVRPIFEEYIDELIIP